MSKKLFNKKFVSKDVYKIKDDMDKYLKDKQNFRKFIEDENIDIDTLNISSEKTTIPENLEDLITSGEEEQVFNREVMLSNDLLGTNQIGFNANQGIQQQIQNQTSSPLNRFVQEVVTEICIDSRDRDISIYTEPNFYKISTGKRVFTNVSSVSLISTEFVNTQQLIKETPVSQKNNVIQWQIEDDLDGNAENIIYTTTLTAGNYTETTLANEIETQMNSIQRVNGAFNNFEVTIDAVTDTVTFTSIEQSTVSNPFTFSIPPITQNFTEVEVALIDHGVTVGSYVFISNVPAEVGGLDASLFNTSHVVASVIDDNTFTINIVGQATSNETGVGGTSVRIGTGIRFKLLFSQDYSPATILGFPEEDTDFAFTIENSSELFLDWDGTGNLDTRLQVETIYKDEQSSVYSLVTTTTNHLLTTGDRVFLFTVDSVSGTTINPYTHLYGLEESDLTEDENNLRKLFIAEIANPAGLIITVVDESSFYIPVPYIDIPKIDDEIVNDTNPDPVEGNGDIVIRNVNNSLNLEGESYIYMCSPQLSNILTTSDVENVFAKIQLAGNSNSKIFNSYVNIGKRYYDSPLPFLDEIEISFRTRDNELFEFNDKNHSFTLQIVESIQKIEGIGYNARIGSRT